MARLTKPKLDVSLPAKPDPTRGGGSWPLVLDHVENWAWRSGVFTPEELDTIIEIGKTAELEKAKVRDTVQRDADRNSFVQFLFPNDITGWLFHRVGELVNEANSQYFGFDLAGLNEGLQFTRYTAPGEHYNWHIDRGYMMTPRKLSLSIQLSDPSEYKGGELQLKFGRRETTVEKVRGMVTFFPSYALHRVKPVTEGTRYSLVAWVSGPPFK